MKEAARIIRNQLEDIFGLNSVLAINLDIRFSTNYFLGLYEHSY